MKKFILSIIVGLMASFTFNSCSFERKLALEFVEVQGKGTPVMLVPPTILNMFNYNSPEYLKDGNSLNQDSVSFYSSKFLQYISDSIFLENYLNAFIQKSYANGLQIYLPEQIDEFLKENRESYIVRLAQMELSEDTIGWVVEEQINFKKIDQAIPVDKLALSTWFEISQKDSSAYYTYFDEQYISDEIYGDYQQSSWSLNITYNYTIYKMEKEDIYNFATDVGRSHASYLYDLILNTYIWNKLPEEKRSNYYYLHYNSDYHSVEVAEEAFIMIDNK